jgi:hypothetical protein
MVAPDAASEFKKAMSKEVQAHTDNGNWRIIRRDEVPEGHSVLPSVLAMRRKRHISTQQVYKIQVEGLLEYSWW